MQTNGIAQGASILSVLDTLKRRKFYILVPALVLTACVVAFVSRLPDWYRAQALLAVEQAAASEYLRGPAMLDRPDIQEQFRVIRETLLAQPLLEEIIKEFKLYELAGRDPDRTLEDMKKRIRILVEGKDAFYVGFEGRDRLQVTEVANRLAELFIRNTSELRERHEDAAVGFVEEELARLKEKLTLQDERIKQYKQRVGQDLPEYLAVNLKTLESLQSRLQTKRDSISENQARRVAVLEQMKGLQDQETQKFREPAREESAAEKRLDELRFKLKDWEGRYTEQYPDLPRLRKEIRELEQTLAAAPPKGRAEAPTGAMRSLELKAELEGIDQRLRSYEQDERELSAQIAGLQQRLASVPTHDRELAEMMREQQVTRSQYQSLLDKQHEVKLAGRLQKTGQGRVFKIVEPARVPQSPYFPQRERLILLGFLASLGLGVVLAFLREHLDTSFAGVDEFKSFTNLPVLAVIPTVSTRPERVKKSRAIRKNHSSTVHPDGVQAGVQVLQPRIKHLQKNRVVMLTDPGAIAAEQYSILAIKVRFHLGEGPSKVLALTSASGGEGKTLTSVNLSLALAEACAGKVILVDADLRKPSVHEYLGIEPGNGLSSLLQDPERDINTEIRKVKKLFVLPGGSDFANPVAALGSEGMRSLIDRLRQEFRFVVLDSPPILPIADSQVLAGYADGVALVLRARRTRRELFQSAVESFRATNLLGVVLNDADLRNSRYARAYAYYKRNYYKRNILTGT